MDDKPVDPAPFAKPGSPMRSGVPVRETDMPDPTRAPVQFPTPGRIVHVFPNGDTSRPPYVGLIARAFGKGGGDAFATINVALFSPEGDYKPLTSVQHQSVAPKGAACWIWPPRV